MASIKLDFPEEKKKKMHIKISYGRKTELIYEYSNYTFKYMFFIIPDPFGPMMAVKRSKGPILCCPT